MPKPIEPSSSSSSAAINPAFIVPVDFVPRFWPAVEKYLEEAYNAADEDIPPDVMPDLLARRRQLWVVWDGRKIIASALTRVIKQRSGLACQITACGGTNAERWADMISRIENFAARSGCRKIFFEGRPGWERLYPAYRRARIILEREISDDERRRQQNDATGPAVGN